jgi:hypothetical protein
MAYAEAFRNVCAVSFLHNKSRKIACDLPRVARKGLAGFGLIETMHLGRGAVLVTMNEIVP